MASGKVHKVKELWDTWDIRLLILLSLAIQVLLTFLAPLRKRSAKGILTFGMWFLYLSASAVALYIISQISGGSSDEKDSGKFHLMAFWAPFLLLHLGGPDTITALALEDNELWHRHALELATQLGVTLYVFVNSMLGHRKSRLWIPTVLMFVDGCIKYFERTQALYYASIDSFRDSLETDPEPGPNYARFMDVYHSSKTANIPITIQRRADGPEKIKNRDNRDSCLQQEVEPSNDDFVRLDTDTIILEAHQFYNKFKGLLADNFLSLKERKKSRDSFLIKKGSDAFRIIEIELNLMYDIFYTKAFLLESKQALFRLISFVSVMASIALFSRLDKRDYHKVDVIITYILLGGAVALDICAAVMLVLSDWYIIIDSKISTGSRLGEWLAFISGMVLKLSRKGRRPSSNRWSRSISGYNLLKRCFKDPPCIYNYVLLKKIKDGLIGLFYVKKHKTQEKETVKFIVEELQKKADLVPDDDLVAIKQVCSARGDLVFEDDFYLISDFLQPWTTDIDYDESLLTWHLATDICFHSQTYSSSQADISKTLSDYMTYLVLRQQTLVSTIVGMSDKRFADTCAEAKAFFDKRLDSWHDDVCVMTRNFLYNMNLVSDPGPHNREAVFLDEFCKQLLDVNVDVRPFLAKGDKSKSVLFEACRLAKQLKMLGEERKWVTISKVWVEMLCYAAVRCSPRSHVAQLNKGGELVTLVWLLMAHLGFGERFLQNQEFGWTKLILQK